MKVQSDDMGWLSAFAGVLLCSYLRTEQGVRKMAFLSSSVLLKNDTHLCTDPRAPWVASRGGHHDPSTQTFERTTPITFRLPK